MIFLRSLLFTIGFFGWTLFLTVFYLPVLPIRQLQPWVIRRVPYFWAAGTVHMLRILCDITYEVSGKEHLPKDTAFIIASNHQSAWETAFFWYVLQKPPVYVLKKELVNIPLFGWHLRVLQQIYIDRKAGREALRSIVKQAKIRLSEGRPIVIFPEGTRVAPSVHKPFQPGIWALYSHDAINVPIIPVALNSGEFWGRNAFLKKPGTIKLAFLPAIKPDLKRSDFMQKLEQDIATKRASF